MPNFPRLLLVGMLLAPGLVRGQEGGGVAPRAPFTRSFPLHYPFPQDSLLGGWRFVSLAGRAGAAAPSAPARWDALPGRPAVRWWLPPCPSDTLIAEAVYRQALRGDYVRYIVTSTQAWGRPLRRAEFEIRLPAGAQPSSSASPSWPERAIPGSTPLRQLTSCPSATSSCAGEVHRPRSPSP